ncbi:hypothetical protein [Streptomyces xanthophaeus]|nr:hypothetical protein [Streptomyces xanthophaeus]
MSRTLTRTVCRSAVTRTATSVALVRGRSTSAIRGWADRLLTVLDRTMPS